MGGWGALSSGGSSPPSAHSAGVTIYSKEQCKAESKYDWNDINYNVEFCAGDTSGGTDSCQGDSGGPLVCIVDSKPVLYGVVSWGIGCARDGYPGVYAKVSSAIEWLEEMTANGGPDTTGSPSDTTEWPFTRPDDGTAGATSTTSRSYSEYWTDYWTYRESTTTEETTTSTYSTTTTTTMTTTATGSGSHIARFERH